jgi:hypothetical protein
VAQFIPNDQESFTCYGVNGRTITLIDDPVVSVLSAAGDVDYSQTSDLRGSSAKDGAQQWLSTP